MALTGEAGGPPLAPPTSAAAALDDVLEPFGLDAAVLGERAAMWGLTRNGRRSCGGATSLLAARDGWVALSLARPDDVVSLPAAFGVEADDAATAWPLVAAVVDELAAADAAARAQLLGMAASVVGGGGGTWEVRHVVRGGGAHTRPPAVLDLSALWAGPLCGHLLSRVGAAVTTVEDARRPDVTRTAHPDFHHLLHAGHGHEAVDLGTARGRAALARLVDEADVVISSARQRAIRQLGLSPEHFLEQHGDRIWVAITGHGWDDDRVGFGDDAAAAAGLVARTDDGPTFAGDAIADPLCGSFAAAAVWDAWAEGGRWFVDASLSGAAARVVGTGPTRPAERRADGWAIDGVGVRAPQRRSS
jgi:hypothetical protein